MLQRIFLLNSQQIARYSTKIKTKPITQTIPLITCKQKQFNFNQTDGVKSDKKFGTIPLASNGWKHTKSKGDYFKIHAINKSASVNSDIGEGQRTFGAFGLHPKLVENIENNLNITNCSYIQHEGIPLILANDHALLAAETGCGKTLAYLVPIVQQILQRKATGEQTDFNTPQALVLTPGRELATQIGDVAEKLCNGLDINVKVLLGGRTKQKMLNPDFDDVDLLVGSMGAISKLVTTSIYRMHQCRHVVLDEADTLMDDSFNEKLVVFLRRFPFYKNHLQDISPDIVGTQLILAAATMPTNTDEILQCIIDPTTIHRIVSPNLHKVLPHIEQNFIRITKTSRPLHLLRLAKAQLEKHHPIIVFSNKSATSDYVSMFLNENNVECLNLNGDMLADFRIGMFDKFQTGAVDILSTTDMASRGLNTTRAQHIVNFDFPLHVSDYIHRIGRIGRIGSSGQCTVTNFISSVRETELVQRIEHAIRTAGKLENVNANITNIIKQKIVKQIESETNGDLRL